MTTADDPPDGVGRAAGPADPEVQLREFVRMSWPRLLATGYLLCGDRHEAEDLVQTALVKVVGAWSRIQRTDEPYAYARKILLNTAASRWRRRRRYDELLVGRRAMDPVPDPAVRVVLQDAVWRALNTLPPRTRTILVLRYFEDLTEAEIAAILRCSVGAVKSQSSRGISRLRARLYAADLTTRPELDLSADGAAPGQPAFPWRIR